MATVKKETPKNENVDNVENDTVDAEVLETEVVEDAVETEVLEADEIMDAVEEPVFEIKTGRVMEMKDQFTNLQDEAYVISQRLADDISMLELDDTKVMITDAIQQLQDFAGANEAVSIGFMSSVGSKLLMIPGAKTAMGAIGAIKDEAEKQAIATGSIKDAAEKLFGTLENKQGTLEKTTYSVMEIKERRVLDMDTLKLMQKELDFILANDETEDIEIFQARNMIIQVKEALIQSDSKIGQVEIIIEAAQSSTFAITSLLPKIKNNFLDDLTISAGLNHLLQYKSMFDETLKLVNDIEEHNFSKINQAMLDVVDLNITTSQTERLTRMGNERIDGQKKLIAKTREQYDAQTRSINELDNVQDQMAQIGSRHTAAMLANPTTDAKATKKATK